MIYDAAGMGDNYFAVAMCRVIDLIGNMVKGIAVEARRVDDSMVSIGPDSKITGNPNQWFVGQFGNTSTSIPLRARYVTTSSPLAAGQANAAATFTMSYQ